MIYYRNDESYKDFNSTFLNNIRPYLISLCISLIRLFLWLAQLQQVMHGLYECILLVIQLIIQK